MVLLGCGSMGAHHLRLLRRNPKVHVECVVDPALQDGLEVPVVRSLETMENLQATIAWIATPIPTHAPLIEMSLNRGMHVFTEKPLAMTSQDAERLGVLAQKKNLLLYVGHSERFNPAYARLRQLLECGGMGRISAIECVRQGPQPARRIDVGVAIDMGVHDLDLIAEHWGFPRSIQGGRRVQNPSSWEDAVDAEMQFDQGLRISISFSRNVSEKKRFWRIHAEAGIFLFDFLAVQQEAAEEPLSLEHRDFFRILERDRKDASHRLHCAIKAVRMAEMLSQLPKSI